MCCVMLRILVDNFFGYLNSREKWREFCIDIYFEIRKW